jgi:hypothetical protein
MLPFAEFRGIEIGSKADGTYWNEFDERLLLNGTETVATEEFVIVVILLMLELVFDPT